MANSTGALAFGNVFTAEAWVKLSSVAGGGQYWALMGKGTNSFAVEIEPGNIFHLAKNGAMPYLATSTASISANTYHHIAVTKNNATIKLYLDGADVTPGVTTNLNMVNNTRPLQIGADGDGGTQFTGIIDEPAFYTTALTAADIALHFNRR